MFQNHLLHLQYPYLYILARKLNQNPLYILNACVYTCNCVCAMRVYMCVHTLYMRVRAYIRIRA